MLVDVYVISYLLESQGKKEVMVFCREDQENNS
jgi:hypothetical protein